MILPSLMAKSCQVRPKIMPSLERKVSGERASEVMCVCKVSQSACAYFLIIQAHPSGHTHA